MKIFKWYVYLTIAPRPIHKGIIWKLKPGYHWHRDPVRKKNMAVTTPQEGQEALLLGK